MACACTILLLVSGVKSKIIVLEPVAHTPLTKIDMNKTKLIISKVDLFVIECHLFSRFIHRKFCTGRFVSVAVRP